MKKIDLRPTKKKVIYSLVISMSISMGFFIFLTANKKSTFEYMSPQQFRIVYLAPILIFLTTYFIVCWFITRKNDARIT